MIKRIILVVWTALHLSLSAQGQVNKGLEPGPAPTPVPGKRIALVIGNAAYQFGTPLRNPVNDAELMAKTLRELNFEVITKKNARLQDMEQALEEFTNTIEKGSYELAMCYYSGHGLEVNGSNYLLPVEANPGRQSDVKYSCLDAQRILDGMEDANAVTKILILDACRDNPLPKGWMKSTGGGLAALPAPKGSLVGYATAPKSKAWDGEGANSPYTAALARYMKEPGLEIGQVMNRTAAATQEAAKRAGIEQIPYSSISLSGDLFLVPGERQLSISSTTATSSTSTPFIEKDLEPVTGTMILIKGGTFQMGCQNKKRGCEENERPVHQVTLSDYYLGETEVTVAQFRAFIEDTGYKTDAERYGGSVIWNENDLENSFGIDWRCDERGKVRFLDEGNFPVIHVSWNDAVSYCNWLSTKSNVQYRLPTEAEWEYAARGGKLSKGYIYAGSDDLEEVAWYASNSGSTIQEVGRKRPNELGLYDMTGSVWEWCSDWYGPYSSGAQMNPTGAPKGSLRVIRGGSWAASPEICRATDRGFTKIENRDLNLGFRIARSY